LAKNKEKLIVSFMGSDLIQSNNGFGVLTIFHRLETLTHRFFARFLYDFTIAKSYNLTINLSRNTKYQIIPNGVDLTDFYPLSMDDAKGKLGLRPDTHYILFASSKNRSVKNFDLAFSAIRMLGNHDLVLLEMNNYSREEVNLLYSSVDCLILTSFHEGSPNVIKEAMACNCPIVATKVGDIEQVISQTPGCFLTTFDVEEIADKLSQALAFSDTVGRTNGRENLKFLRLDSHSIALKLIDLYRRVISKSEFV